MQHLQKSAKKKQWQSARLVCELAEHGKRASIAKWSPLDMCGKRRATVCHIWFWFVNAEPIDEGAQEKEDDDHGDDEALDGGTEKLPARLDGVEARKQHEAKQQFLQRCHVARCWSGRSMWSAVM